MDGVPISELYKTDRLLYSMYKLQCYLCLCLCVCVRETSDRTDEFGWIEEKRAHASRPILLLVWTSAK